MLYGTRSERLRGDRLDDEQIDFVFEEIETGVAAIDAELATAAKDKPKRAPRTRKGFAPHLERIEQVIEPEVPPGCEDLEKVLIGEDVSERLDVTAAKFRVLVTRRPKYAYRGRDGVIQAPAPPHIIESGIPTEALLAQIAVAKYADGLPLLATLQHDSGIIFGRKRPPQCGGCPSSLRLSDDLRRGEGGVSIILRHRLPSALRMTSWRPKSTTRKPGFPIENSHSRREWCAPQSH